MNTHLENSKKETLAAIEQYIADLQRAAKKLAAAENYNWGHQGSLAHIEIKLAELTEFAQSGTR